MLVVNLFGAPSAGKSTTASYLFYELKKLGINCELVTEVAKDLCWQEDNIGLRNQMCVAGNQIMRLDRLKDKVDIVITDAPLMLQTIYYRLNNCPEPGLFDLIMKKYSEQYDNLNFKLKYNPDLFKSTGRIHDNEQAYNIDIAINGILSKYEIEYREIEQNNINEILKDVLKMLHYNKILNKGGM